MAEYQLSNKASADTFDIYFYSFEQFGEDQADSYLTGLKEKLLFVAERPYIGKKINDIPAAWVVVLTIQQPSATPFRGFVNGRR